MGSVNGETCLHRSLRESDEIRRVHGPGEKSRVTQVAHLGEPCRRALLGIGRKNFQIAARPERQQRVPRAPAGMSATESRAHAGTMLHPGHAPVEVVNS